MRFLFTVTMKAVGRDAIVASTTIEGDRMIDVLDEDMPDIKSEELDALGEELKANGELDIEYMRLEVRRSRRVVV